jgi:hypothetical protein
VSDNAARLSAKLRAFEARATGWPLWKKLAVFTPVFFLVTVPVVVLLVSIGGAFVRGHH